MITDWNRRDSWVRIIVFILLMHTDKHTHTAQHWVTNLQSSVNNSADQKHAPIINSCNVCLVLSDPHARLKYSQRGLGLASLEFDSRCVICVSMLVCGNMCAYITANGVICPSVCVFTVRITDFPATTWRYSCAHVMSGMWCLGAAGACLLSPSDTTTTTISKGEIGAFIKLKCQ